MNPAHFFAELRRRNVTKVAVGYAAVGWLVVQLADLIVSALRLPASLATVVVVLTLLGFPLALVIAWTLEMTPDGMKRTENVSPNEKNPQWSQRKFWIFVLVVGLVATGLFAWQKMRSRARPSAENSLTALLRVDPLPSDSRLATFAAQVR